MRNYRKLQQTTTVRLGWLHDHDLALTHHWWYKSNIFTWTTASQKTNITLGNGENVSEVIVIDADKDILSSNRVMNATEAEEGDPREMFC